MAGVSKTSVSYALSGKPEVSPSLRIRIQRLAQEMGYHPDPALARIAASRWKNRPASEGTTLAFIETHHPKATHSIETIMANGKISPEFRGSQETAARLGYQLEYYFHSSKDSARKLGDLLSNRGVPGVVISPIFSLAFHQEFHYHKFACVSYHNGYIQPAIDHFTPAYVNNLLLCWEKTRILNYKKPRLVLFQEDHHNYINFILEAAFTKLCQDDGLSPASQTFYYNPEKANEIKQWIKLERPDLIIAFNDYPYWVMRDLNILPNKSLGCMAIVSEPVREADGTNLIAGVDSRRYEIGVHCVERIHELLNYGRTGVSPNPLTHRLPGTWVDGKSIRKESNQMLTK